MIKENDPRLRKWQRRQFSRLGLVAAGFLLVAFLAQAAMIILVRLMNRLGTDFDLSDRGVSMFLSAVSMYLIAFPASAAMLQLIPKCGAPQKQPWGMGKFAACLVVAMGIGLAGGLVGRLVELLKPLNDGGSQLADALSHSPIWMNVLVTVIMAPIVEELFFRKLLMDRMLGFGEMPAIFMSGLMFGLVHGNFSQFFYAFGLGLMFAYIYAKTGKVGYTIACHMIFNLLGGVIVNLLNRGAGGLLNDSWFLQGFEHFTGIDPGTVIPALCRLLLIVYGAMMVACFIGGITILIRYRREIRLLQGPWPVQKKFQTVILNAGMLLYICICTGLFVLSWWLL